jgi:rod shape-determining protein MreC
MLTGRMFSVVQQVKNYTNLKQINEQLLDENTKIKNTLASAYKSNRITFREINDSLYEKKWSYIDAQIAFNSTNRQNNIIVIDKGSKHGITSEMGVITDRGVIGIVRNVSSNYSLALSLLNSSVIISARHKNSGYFGPLKWDGIDTRFCRLSDIPNHVKINNGDTIITSGFSSVFPENIMIGTVSDFNKTEDMNFYNVKVELFQDFNIVSYIYIVKSIFKNEIDSLINIVGHD